MNLNSFQTNRLFGGFGTVAVDPSAAAVPTPGVVAARSGGRVVTASADALVTAEEAVLDFLRDKGHDTALPVLGGGGKGHDFISPIRRSVNVSWAFVGAPTRSVLCVTIREGKRI